MADHKNAAEGQRGPTAPAAGPVRALDHVGISVPDIDAAVAWYRDILGCYVLMEPIEGYADDSYFGQIVADIFGADFKGMKIAHLATADGVGIELFQFVANAPQEEHFAYWKTGIYHICILEPDIEGLAKRIDESGGRQRSKVWKLWPDKPYKVCYCEDPWGTIIEVSSHPYIMAWSNFIPSHGE